MLAAVRGGFVPSSAACEPQAGQTPSAFGSTHVPQLEQVVGSIYMTPDQNPYSRAGLSTRIFLRIAGSGAQTANSLRSRPSSIGSGGDTSVGLRPGRAAASGWGQSVPHTIRSGLASISARPRGATSG